MVYGNKSGCVAVNTADSIYICDYATRTVCLVSVSGDSVITQLGVPAEVQTHGVLRYKHKTELRSIPYHASVLGERILVCYGKNTVATYHHDSPTPVQVLQTSKLPSVQSYISPTVSSITTDGQRNFLITEKTNNSVIVLDKAGNIRHRIQPESDSGAAHNAYGPSLQDCAVVQSQLLLGYEDGSIAVVSPLWED